MRRLTVLCFLVALLTAFHAWQKQPFIVPAGWPKPNYNFTKKPLTKETIELGRVLFYDPILSANNTISCESCHSPYTAFAHVDHHLSHGIYDRIGTRNAPALVNLAWHQNFMWDGSISNLDEQAALPITHKNEMGEKIPNLVYKLQTSALYPALFYKAYGDSQITSEKIFKALSQFALTLVSSNARYDSVMRKQTSFTTQEQNGYLLFQKNCASCHTEPLFTNLQFENNGLPTDSLLNDYGRMLITLKPTDSLKFKVPTLRNIEFSFPYMHDGRFRKIQEVLNHYTSGINQSPTLAKQLQKPIMLSANEKVDLTAFLLTLTDKSFLFNPNHGYPKK